ncbi:MAG: uroporphyrinogen-III synthase [Planctomycetota bacterium]
MSARRVLVTGPVESLSDYSRAAAAAGWEPIELPLLEIEFVDLDAASACAGAFDRIVITSSTALRFVEAALLARPKLCGVRASVVGERTADKARALGLAAVDSPARDVDDLARGLLDEIPKGARVLWPHGDQSDALAHALRSIGVDVVDPVVYRVRPTRDAAPPPAADAVFFASPSAIRAWLARAAHANDSPTVAIAIGRTTHHALLAETALAFFDTISLPMPTPEAFAHVLGHLDPRARL